MINVLVILSIITRTVFSLDPDVTIQTDPLECPENLMSLRILLERCERATSAEKLLDHHYQQETWSESLYPFKYNPEKSPNSYTGLYGQPFGNNGDHEKYPDLLKFFHPLKPYRKTPRSGTKYPNSYRQSTIPQNDLSEQPPLVMEFLNLFKQPPNPSQLPNSSGQPPKFGEYPEFQEQPPKVPEDPNPHPRKALRVVSISPEQPPQVPEYPNPSGQSPNAVEYPNSSEQPPNLGEYPEFQEQPPKVPEDPNPHPQKSLRVVSISPEQPPQVPEYPNPSGQSPNAVGYPNSFGKPPKVPEDPSISQKVDSKSPEKSQRIGVNPNHDEEPLEFLNYPDSYVQPSGSQNDPSTFVKQSPSVLLYSNPYGLLEYPNSHGQPPRVYDYVSESIGQPQWIIRYPNDYEQPRRPQAPLNVLEYPNFDEQPTISQAVRSIPVNETKQKPRRSKFLELLSQIKEKPLKYLKEHPELLKNTPEEPQRLNAIDRLSNFLNEPQSKHPEERSGETRPHDFFRKITRLLKKPFGNLFQGPPNEKPQEFFKRLMKNSNWESTTEKFPESSKKNGERRSVTTAENPWDQPGEIKKSPWEYKDQPGEIEEQPGNIQELPLEDQTEQVVEYPEGVEGQLKSIQYPGRIQGQPGGAQGYSRWVRGPSGGVQGYPWWVRGPPGGVQGYPWWVRGPPGGVQGYPWWVRGQPGGVQGYPWWVHGPPGGVQVYSWVIHGQPDYVRPCAMTKEKIPRYVLD